MKNALIKDIFREIGKSKGRFFSIFTIIALGCGFFSGIKATMPDMVETAEVYFDENNLMDLKLISSIGIKSEDVEAVKQCENVSGVMAGYSKDVFYLHNNQNLVLKIMSYNDSITDDNPNNLNKLVLLEGRFPENPGECLVEVKMSSPETFKIGEKISFQDPDDDLEITDSIKFDTYEITGIVTSPMYIGYERDSTRVGNGTIVSNVFLPESEFKSNYYTEMFVKFNNTESINPFSDEYKQIVENNSQNVISKFEESVNARYSDNLACLQNKVTSAEEKVETIENLLNLDKSELTKLKNETNEKIVQAEKAYEDSQGNNISQNLAKSSLLQAQQLSDMIAELIDDFENNGNTVHDEYFNQLNNSKSEISSYKQSINDLAEPTFYQFDRFEASEDYSSYYGDSQKIDSIAKVFPVFFILVAGLVCLTTMTRMVEEQRVQIGTYKALGYSSFKIVSKFLVYSIVAAALGSCVGTAIGLQIFPYIIFKCYKILYNIPKLITPFKLSYMLACCGVSVICSSLAVIYACSKELRVVPSALMRPKLPSNGKRILLEKVNFVWNRLSFLSKVTFRNLFRYKKRFIMTLVGVIGCTALIITGFGLKYSIKSIADKQFNEVFLYDGMIMMNSSSYTEENLEEKISSVEQVGNHLFVQMSDITTSNDEQSQSASLIVVKNDKEMSNYIKLEDCSTGETLDILDGEVVITEKLSILLNLNKGDNISLKIDNQERNFKISAVSVNYAMHYIYMNANTYADVFGKSPVYNISLVKFKENMDENAFKESLISNDEFYGITYKSDSSRGFLNSVDSLNAIVVLLIACAGLLAVVVLYNLANINITERRREIATIKVLGFYDNETSDYICRENYISTIIGILLGFVIGKILHYFVVITAEVDIVMFNRQLIWWAYLLGAVMTMFFTILVNGILHYKLKKVDMVESLKSVE